MTTWTIVRMHQGALDADVSARRADGAVLFCGLRLSRGWWCVDLRGVVPSGTTKPSSTVFESRDRAADVAGRLVCGLLDHDDATPWGIL